MSPGDAIIWTDIETGREYSSKYGGASVSGEYVEKRLREISHEGGQKQVLWSLSAGCWMLCDLSRSTCEPVTVLEDSPSPQSGDSNG